jgi:hypothetical protein
VGFNDSKTLSGFVPCIKGIWFLFFTIVGGDCVEEHGVNCRVNRKLVCSCINYPVCQSLWRWITVGYGRKMCTSPSACETPVWVVIIICIMTCCRGHLVLLFHTAEVWFGCEGYGHFGYSLLKETPVRFGLHCRAVWEYWLWAIFVYLLTFVKR